MHPYPTFSKTTVSLHCTVPEPESFLARKDTHVLVQENIYIRVVGSTKQYLIKTSKCQTLLMRWNIFWIKMPVWPVNHVSDITNECEEQKPEAICEVFFFSLFDSVSIEPISNVISDYTASHCCSFQVSIIKLLNSLWRRKWKWTWGDKIAYFIIIITALVNSIVDVFFLKMLWICTKRSKLTFNMTSKLKRIREGYQCN